MVFINNLLFYLSWLLHVFNVVQTKATDIIIFDSVIIELWGRYVVSYSRSTIFSADHYNNINHFFARIYQTNIISLKKESKLVIEQSRMYKMLSKKLALSIKYMKLSHIYPLTKHLIILKMDQDLYYDMEMYKLHKTSSIQFLEELIRTNYSSIFYPKVYFFNTFVNQAVLFYMEQNIEYDTIIRKIHEKQLLSIHYKKFIITYLSNNSNKEFIEYIQTYKILHKKLSLFGYYTYCSTPSTYSTLITIYLIKEFIKNKSINDNHFELTNPCSIRPMYSYNEISKSTCFYEDLKDLKTFNFYNMSFNNYNHQKCEQIIQTLFYTYKNTSKKYAYFENINYLPPFLPDNNFTKQLYIDIDILHLYGYKQEKIYDTLIEFNKNCTKGLNNPLECFSAIISKLLIETTFQYLHLSKENIIVFYYNI